MTTPHDELDALIHAAKQRPPVPPTGAVTDGWSRLRGSLGAAVVVPQIDVPPGLVESAIAGKTVAATATTVVGWGQGLGWVGKAIASAVVTVTVGGIGVAASGVGQRGASPMSQGVATSAALPSKPEPAPAEPPAIGTPAELPGATPATPTPTTLASTLPTPESEPATGKRKPDARKRGAEEEAPLIAAAFKALNDGDPNAALRELARHKRQHPRGSMREDREAVRVIALCKAGRTADGTAARTEFLNEWPSSPHASRVRASCTTK